MIATHPAIKTRHIDYREEIREVASAFGVHPCDIIGTGKTQRVYLARCAVIDRLHRRGWSSVKIGKALHRHHTSILYALGKLKPRPPTNRPTPYRAIRVMLP